MKVILEAVIVLVIAAVAGTIVHGARADKKNKIAFVGDYPHPYRISIAAELPPPVKEGGDGTSVTPTLAPRSEHGPEANGEEPEPYVDPDGVITEIRLEETHQWFLDEVPFLDARRTRLYEEGHIKGAIAMSVWEGDFGEKFDLYINTAEADLPCVIYCNGKRCEDSHRLAERLKASGFSQVMVFKDGYPTWKAAGHPIEAGPEKPAGE